MAHEICRHHAPFLFFQRFAVDVESLKKTRSFYDNTAIHRKKKRLTASCGSPFSCMVCACLLLKFIAHANLPAFDIIVVVIDIYFAVTVFDMRIPVACNIIS